MKNIWMTAAAALCFTAGAAHADVLGYDTSNSYVSLLAGVSMMPDENVRFGSANVGQSFDTGGAFGVGIGSRMGNWRMEIDALHSHGPAQSGTDGYVNGTSVMLNSIYDFNPEGTFNPYIGAGIGYVNIADKIAGVKDDAWEPGYQLRGGISTGLGEGLSAFTEYRWQEAESAKLNMAGTTVKQQFKNNAVLVGVNYAL